MSKIKILLTLILCVFAIENADAAQRNSRYKKTVAKTYVARKKAHGRSHAAAKPKPKPRPVAPQLTIHENSFYICEDTCSHVHGVDMSHYQGDIHWPSLGEQSKMAYVYLKATEGGDRVDSRYEYNIDLARRHGLKVGSYHFFRPATNLQAQLDNFRSQCKPGQQDLIPMLDIETMGGLSEEAFCDSLHKFLGMLEDTYRQKPLIYTFRNFYNWHLLGQIDDYQLMIAMYADEEPVLADDRDYIIWQYSCRSRVAGVDTHVDKSRLMGNHSLRELKYHH